ncbi:Uma2 family endonuclease [Deinococcus sp. Arct2-2]|uniref:Uma2 family endonuclease n=1 Tax=Deinococcus sp. Arct2-2 TaxID=2568653 RepID=UPI001454D62A|nr:Uma2 family endonuclease [Deinococcus sp. Arct2-2]
MSDPALRTLTEEEYLRTEEDSPVRREYVDGFVYAQAGATNAHNLITSNIHVALYRPARNAGCHVYQSDMKVHVQRIDSKRFYYPDLVISCEKLSNKATALEEPCLIVEILSAGTRQVDMTYKVKDHLSLPSL